MGALDCFNSKVLENTILFMTKESINIYKENNKVDMLNRKLKPFSKYNTNTGLKDVPCP